MKKPRTLIVGHGEIGRELEKELAPIKPDIADTKYANYFKEMPRREKYDAIFICVPAEIQNGKLCDLSNIESAINTNITDLDSDGVMVICTTVLPGSTEELKRNHPYVPIVAAPIWYGCTVHSNREKFNFTVLGGEKPWVSKVQQIFQKCHDASHRFIRVTSIAAELAKYMENCWIATKVTFCNQFASIAHTLNVDYNDVREIFIADPRVNSSHTFVEDGQPYFNSHCTLKDVQALALSTENPLLDAVWKINAQIKAAYDGESEDK